MAKEVGEVKKNRFLREILPVLFILLVLGLAWFNVMNPGAFNGLKNMFQFSSSDPFTGEWNTVSPATYYLKDIDGERYAKYTANFHLTITKEGNGYFGAGWLSDVSSSAIPGAMTPITPLVPNPDGKGYSSPLSFDARGYFEPQQGVSSMDLSGNTMTITTPLFGGTEKIILNLNGNTLYATLSVIPTSRGQSMGEETDTPIILIKK